jgi:hypothetical protein
MIDQLGGGKSLYAHLAAIEGRAGIWLNSFQFTIFHNQKSRTTPVATPAYTPVYFFFILQSHIILVGESERLLNYQPTFPNNEEPNSF